MRAAIRPGIWWRPNLSSLFLLALAACATPERATDKPSTPDLVLSATSFAALPGWNDDAGFDAAALKRSCPQLMKNGTAKPVQTSGADWALFCNQVNASITPAALRDLIASMLKPYRLNPPDSGLFTGYYEPLLRASRTRDATYNVPIYKRPASLVEVDLGAFRDSLKGQKITGRLADGKHGKTLLPFYDRAAIADGKLDSANVLLWAADPVDVFFLEVQGSGRAQLPDGTTIRLGFDAQNGYGYTAIGKVLKDHGEIAPPVSMEKIRAWLAAHPEQRQDILNTNQSYVFFRELTGSKDDGPIGAANLPLTPQRSLAVDKALYSYNQPLWLETTTGDGVPLQRLMVAQDTGGAITGVVRGDVFWGFGDEAARQAGQMQQPGALYLLLPKSVTP